MFNKSSKVALFTLVMVVFMLLSLSWAEKSYKDKGQGYLGVYLQELTSDLKESLDLGKSVEGVLISGVVEDSPAEEAGLEDGDVIISFDGKKVYSVKKLTSLVRKTEPGSRVKVKIIRDGDDKRLTVTLGEKSSSISYELLGPEKIIKLKKGKMQPFEFTFYSRPKLGILIQDLTEQLGEYFGVMDGEGILITEVIEGSPAEEAGLKAGDVILEIDNQKVEDSGELFEAISDKEKGDRVELEVLRDKRSKRFSLTLKEEEWSKEFIEGMEKIKILPKKLDRIEIPEIPEIDIRKEYSLDEKKFKQEMKELKKELKELKKELENLREEMR